MMERLTADAKRTLELAATEAHRRGSPCIEADDLLAVVARQGPDIVERIPGLRGFIAEHATVEGERTGECIPMPLSPAAEQVLRFAREEADRRKEPAIGLTHLLFGLLQAGDGVGARFVTHQRMTSETIRAALFGSGPRRRPLRKAVFPAAGLGTRFLPATKAQPKEMLPLVDKPLIQYAVEEAIASGIEQIIIITGRGKNAIEDHFDIAFELEQALEEKGRHDQLEEIRRIATLTRFAYIRQKKALGLGHAVLVARDLVDNEPFAVLLGDDVVDSDVPCLKQLLDVFDRYEAPIVAITPVEGPAISRFGVIQAEEVEPGVYRIFDMVEKPRYEDAPSNLAIIGRYILTPDIFEELERTPVGAGGEIQLTDAMRSLLRRRPFYGFRFQGKRYDAGDKLGFLMATVELALKREDIGSAFHHYLRELLDTYRHK
jgi:UTP--glucose-1-phosphate uridylyltransferase